MFYLRVKCKKRKPKHFSFDPNCLKMRYNKKAIKSNFD